MLEMIKQLGRVHHENCSLRRIKPLARFRLAISQRSLRSRIHNLKTQSLRRYRRIAGRMPSLQVT
jgi:hypothetical protein